jgi:hypothetical protein
MTLVADTGSMAALWFAVSAIFFVGTVLCLIAYRLEQIREELSGRD